MQGLFEFKISFNKKLNILQFHDKLRQEVRVVVLNVEGRQLHGLVSVRDGHDLYHLRERGDNK